MNKTEFGKLFGATGSLVNKWENHNVIPSEERLKEIAQLDNSTVDELLYGNPNIKQRLDRYLSSNLNNYLQNKKEVAKEELKFYAGRPESFLSKLGLDNLDSKSIPDEGMEIFKERHDRINNLEKLGKEYINSKYENYTFEKYLQDFPDSDSEGFQQYKLNQWLILKEILDNYWESYDIVSQNYYWINTRFTDQIKDDLDKISEKAIREGKEHYYVNEIVQAFLDQTAKDFKEYIKDYIDIQDSNNSS